MLTRSFMATAALGALLAASAAGAQPAPPPPDYGAAGYGPPQETVVVIPPRTYIDPLHLPGYDASHLQVSVNSIGLDLLSYDGARAFRERVRVAAHEVCDELAARWYFADVTQKRCYPQAVRDGMAQANIAITRVREQYAANYGYDRRYAENQYDNDGYYDDDGGY